MSKDDDKEGAKFSGENEDEYSDWKFAAQKHIAKQKRKHTLDDEGELEELVGLLVVGSQPFKTVKDLCQGNPAGTVKAADAWAAPGTIRGGGRRGCLQNDKGGRTQGLTAKR